MTGGNKAAAVAMLLAAAGCAGQAGELHVRSISSPLAGSAPVPARVAEGKAMLAIGNVGLALEAFRKALREDPGSTAALAGIAAAYDGMARFDLSRRYYEEALALAPRDAAILTALAQSMERQGDREGAARIRAELAQLALPQPSRALSGAEAAAEHVLETATAEAPPIAAASVAARSVTLSLPPAAPAVTVHRLPPAAEPPQPQAARRAIQPPVEEQSAPRLERLSPHEVALLTAREVQWSARILRQSPTSVTVKLAPPRPRQAAGKVRLLNAARVQGLAARTRAYLSDRGWDRIEIGDARRAQASSLILHPASRRLLAARLARQFGFPTRERAAGRDIIVLLGRDAARGQAGRARS